jgi:hypothetical protein
LLVESVVRCGKKIDEDFCLIQTKEQDVNLLKVPFQYLGPLASEMAQRGRTKSDWSTKPTKFALREIDTDASKRDPKLEKEELGILLTMQIGGGYGKEDLAGLDEEVSQQCDYCSKEVGSVDHLIFECEFFWKRERKLIHNLPLSEWNGSYRR